MAVRDILHISFCFRHTFLKVNTHSAYYFTILPADGNVTITSPPLLLIGYVKSIRYLRVLYEFGVFGLKMLILT